MAQRWITTEKRAKIYARDNHTCIYCGKTCVEGDTRTASNPKDIATLDHIVSQKELAAAADSDEDFSRMRKDAKNLVVACMGCNSSKKHTPLLVFCKRVGLDYTAILAEIARRTSIALEY